LGAGGLVAVPSYAETTSPVWPDIEKYFQSVNSDSRARIKLFRLAFDAAISTFAGRQQLYERYYSGDPVRLAATLYSIYERDSYIDRISRLLDDLEARQTPSTSGGPSFRSKLEAAE
jgi:4-hydroxyphenylacetate 3-monooxygenase